MKEKFPDVPAPALPPDGSNLAFAYAYFKGAVEFKTPYQVNQNTLQFSDSSGRRHAARSFGVPVASPYCAQTLGEQVEIMHAVHTRDSDGVKEFVLDMCKHSRPNQLLLARVERKETLHETLADVQDKMDRHSKDKWERAFDANDTLLVPFLSCRIAHRFKELEGPDRPIQGTGLKGAYIATALQVIDFQLDPQGARVASGAFVEVKSRGPRKFHFDRPFLICLKKRGASRPFFVMWVDNAELLRQG
jgi:hypothetical protein